MFRPFVGEVLLAKLKRCDKTGLYCMTQPSLHHKLVQGLVFRSNKILK